MRTFLLSFLKIGATGLGVHYEGRPPESRDGSEEQNLPATNYEYLVSGLEKMSVRGESATHDPQHHSQHQHHKQSTYQPLQHL